MSTNKLKIICLTILAVLLCWTLIVPFMCVDAILDIHDEN